MKKPALLLPFVAMALCSFIAFGQSSDQRVEIARKGETIVFEPYGENILRVTLSLNKEAALRGPGYGIVGTPDAHGWSRSETDDAVTYGSQRIVVTIGKDKPSNHPPLQSQIDIGKFFNGSVPGAYIQFKTPAGKNLLTMQGWSQAVPNHKDGTADIAHDRRATDAEFYTVGASFLRRTTSTTTGWGKTRKGFSISAGTRCDAGTTTRAPRRRRGACLSW